MRKSKKGHKLCNLLSVCPASKAGFTLVHVQFLCLYSAFLVVSHWHIFVCVFLCIFWKCTKDVACKTFGAYSKSVIFPLPLTDHLLIFPSMLNSRDGWICSAPTTIRIPKQWLQLTWSICYLDDNFPPGSFKACWAEGCRHSHPWPEF